jgi:putative membrane protein
MNILNNKNRHYDLTLFLVLLLLLQMSSITCNKLSSKTYIILFCIILVITAIANLALSQWKKVFLSLLALICLPIPFIIAHIANKKKFKLPSSFELLAVLFIFATQYLGEIVGLYKKLMWWDLLLHGLFGAYSVIIALHLVNGIIRKEGDITEKRFIIFTLIFAFGFTMSLGILWELFEFIGDYLFKTQMAKDRPNDSIADLAIKAACAFFTSVIYYYRKLKKQMLFNK